MAYETGTATSIDDLLDKLVTFCEANGWTRDDKSSEGTGHRWHAHRGSVYANFRSFIVETLNSEVKFRGASTTGIAFNIGTGYNGATAWYKQVGTPKNAASSWLTSGISAATGAITAYHFFAQNSGDQIYVVLEVSSGSYRYFGFGSAITYGTLTGGTLQFASGCGVRATSEIGIGFYQPAYSGFGEPSSSFYANAMMTVDVDAETGWHCSVGQSQASMPTQSTPRLLVDKHHISTIAGVLGWPNTLNGVAVLEPVIPMVFRDTTNGLTSPITPIGEIPNIFYCGIRSLVPCTTNYVRVGELQGLSIYS
jgi:hypothetical protein